MLAALLAALPELVFPGFYYRDDMQSQYVPVLREIARAVGHGQLPLLTDETWFGGAIAGEYQHGALSLPHALLALLVVKAGLSLRGIALAVGLLYTAFCAAGAFRLARRWASPLLSTCVAWVAALNGFNVDWGSWLPAIVGFAWVPWFWWALERRLAARGRGRDAALALATYGLLSAGWHFALLMAALITLFSFAPAATRPRFMAQAVGVVPGLMTGALLSAPALLCFAEYARASARIGLGHASWTWTTPLGGLLGLVMPTSSSRWHVFEGLDTIPNAALSGGALPLLVLPSALARSRPEHRRIVWPALGLALLALLLAVTPSLWWVRWPFRWLPLAHLSLAIAAVQAAGSAQPALTDSPRAWLYRPGTLATVAALLALATSPTEPAALPSMLGVIMTAAVLSLAQRTARFTPLALSGGVLLNLALCPLSWPPRDLTPRWEVQDCFRPELGRGLRQLQLYRADQIIATPRYPHQQTPSVGSCLMPGNMALNFERKTAGGYSVLFPAGISQILGFGVHGEVGQAPLRRLLDSWASPGSLLDRWGIEALVVPNNWLRASNLEANGFAPAQITADATLLLRKSATRPSLVQPLVSVTRASDVLDARSELLAGPATSWQYVGPDSFSGKLASAQVALVRADPTLVEARVVVPQDHGDALIMLRRPLLPGYFADLDGEPLKLGRADGVFPTVRLPAGRQGLLRFEYRPLGVRLPGQIAFLLGAALLGGFLLAALRERPAPGDQCRAP